MNTLPRRFPNVTRWALIGGAVALAWLNRFVQDDAFISFRYAQNLAQGHGLVYNIGERVEGYTNFLWTVCMTPAFVFGMDVVTWSYCLSLLVFVVTLSVSAKLAHAMWGDARASLIVIVLLATNYSFSCYATGGLETQFGIAWLMLSVWLLHANRLVPAALCSACAVMTRMDAALILFPFWFAVVWGAVRHRKAMGSLASALALGTIPVLAWVLWRHHYYGAWLPNTFLIKGHGLNLLRGFYYVSFFYAIYALWLVIPLCGAKWHPFMRQPTGLCIVISAIAWTLYVTAVGGDFMEFRLMMPTLPFVMIFVGGVITETIRRGNQTIGAGVLAAMVLVSLLHGTMKWNYPCMSSISELKGQHRDWRTLADAFNAVFGDAPDVKIGITCAGIIPFYTQRPALDLMGLNDRDVALAGEAVEPLKWVGNRPGHIRMATWGMTLEKEVNLLINNPWVVDPQSHVLAWDAQKIVSHWFFGEGANPERVYASGIRLPSSGAPIPPVIAWPLSDGRYWLMAYLKPHPAVDDAIRRVGAKLILPVNE
ncbi:MAG: emopamil-binding family protein [Kiritimatiellaeota bacterium]|nr:emopamil-binding family protein [Kiritimatiellota bacterium]